MKHILTLIFTLALVPLTSAQNIGLVTDTNGNVVTRRTNELVWSNNLRFTPLTNANTRTAIIGTNGALSAGSVPSGAAAEGSVLTGDGAGGSSFAASRVQVVRKQTNTDRVNWTNNTIADSANNDTDPSLVLEANSTYRIEFEAEFVANTNNVPVGWTFTSSQAMSATAPSRNGWAGNGAGNLTAIGWNSGQATAANASSGGALIFTFSGWSLRFGGTFYITTGANPPNVFYRWYPTNNVTNTVTLTTNTWLRAEKILP